jgi:hypothetical protein
VAEETGLEINGLRYLCSHPNSYIYHEHPRPVCDAFFIAHTTLKTICPLPGEILECFWQKPETIDPDDLAFDSMRVALRTFLDRAPTY